jgi:hypothetical protein
MYSDQQTNMPDQSSQTYVNYDIQKHTNFALGLQNKCVLLVTRLPLIVGLKMPSLPTLALKSPNNTKANSLQKVHNTTEHCGFEKKKVCNESEL